MDKQYRRVLSIISKYFYRPKKYASVSETREVKLNCLLELKLEEKKSRLYGSFSKLSGE
jgi:hypothetical protein